MPSMMTTCAAHQVRPEAHAVVLHLFAAFIDFSPLLEKCYYYYDLRADQPSLHAKSRVILDRQMF